MTILDHIRQPWPWYVSGPAIASIMLLLVFFGRSFGVSSNFRTMCSIAGAGKRVPFFRFDHKAQYWNLLFLAGTVAGGFIASHWLSSPRPLQLSAATIRDLADLHIHFDGLTAPSQLFGSAVLLTAKGWIILAAGGFLVGFGSRYAGGCTSGHAISGLSNLQFPSLIAVTGFFAGGLIMTHLLYPLIF
ncbi:YeeE/YedE family protein [Chitinophaga filiformis]|uniref:YeeE/YedE family protein n=1 Tax=Chitinophaga filiformis TaxID=104663 RepID=UPI001F19BAB4|nr:YeeE/YedE thiosulfate transporter family protein [Chitinophaga filiformis]MCF6403005.1 YeeE/YedE family protein [Chitinophaga filiformis]